VAAAAKTLPNSSTARSSPEIMDGPHLKVCMKDFLSTQDVMNDPSFFHMLDTSSSKMQDIFDQACELERKNTADEKKQKAVSTPVDINHFMEHIDPKIILPLTPNKSASRHINISQCDFVAS
jgi:hypothetical protein